MNHTRIHDLIQRLRGIILRKKQLWKSIFLALILPPLIMTFQNCGKGFKFEGSNESSSSQGSPLPESGPNGSSEDQLTKDLERGSALYQSHCKACHLEIQNSTKKNTTVAKVTNAIQLDATMKGLTSLKDLSVDDIRVIVLALNSSMPLLAQSNFTRSSAGVLSLRLKSLFPSIDEKTITDGSYALANYLGQPNFLNTFTTQNSISATAQQSLRKTIASLCRTTNLNLTLFLESGILMSGEVLPTDSLTRRAFSAARNGWLAPYEVSSVEVQSLLKLIQLIKSDNGTPTDIDHALCMTVIMAPQFWLGTPGPTEILRRLSLDIGHRLPKFSEYEDFLQKRITLSDFVRRLQQEESYLDTLKEWHRAWFSPLDTYKYFSEDFGGIFGNFRGYKYHMGQNGPGMIAGQRFEAKDSSGTLDPTIPIVSQVVQNNSSLSSTEGCEPKPQNFDPKTERLQWEQKVSGQWYIVGGWKKVSGLWQKFSGSVLIGTSAVITTVDDIRYTPSVGGGFFHYISGNLAGLDNFPANSRRLRRFTTPDDVDPNAPSPPQEQNGYSKVNLWWSAKPVYVCNVTTRFLASCAFRPAAGTFNITSGSETNWNASQRTIYLYMGGSAFLGIDSLGHPEVLDQMKCWIDPSKFPGGSTPANLAEVEKAYSTMGPLSTLNETAINFELSPSSVALQNKYLSLKAENDALAQIATDMRDEPTNLVVDIVRNNLDYRQILTADWTIGSGALELLYRTQAQFMTAYPPNQVDLPTSPNYTKQKRLNFSSFTPIPAAWFMNSIGGFTTGYTMDNTNDKLFNLSSPTALYPRTISGVITQAAFLTQAKPKIRSLSAKILRTFTCGDVNLFVPNQGQTSVNIKYIPYREMGGSAHIDPSSTCIKCHINMDPLAAALSTGFLKTKNVPGTSLVAESLFPSGELVPYSPEDILIRMSYGLVGQSTELSSGAVFGQEVKGIRAAAQVLANSSLFSRCAVIQAFKGIFSRDPIGAEDWDLIDKTQHDWPATNYNYNRMIEALVTSSVYQQRN